MSTHDASEEARSLFDAPPAEEVEETGTAKLATDFVRWCCNFGPEFRNSPDITNLRYWAQKNKIKIKDRNEPEVLEIARPLFLKRIEQVTRISEGPN